MQNAFRSVPTNYSVLLVSIDGLVEETMIHELAIDEMSDSSLTLSIPDIPRRRLWNYTMLAYDCGQHPLLDTSELSKFMDFSEPESVHLYIAISESP